MQQGQNVEIALHGAHFKIDPIGGPCVKQQDSLAYHRKGQDGRGIIERDDLNGTRRHWLQQGHEFQAPQDSFLFGKGAAQQDGNIHITAGRCFSPRQ